MVVVYQNYKICFDEEYNMEFENMMTNKIVRTRPEGVDRALMTIPHSTWSRTETITLTC